MLIEFCLCVVSFFTFSVVLIALKLKKPNFREELGLLIKLEAGKNLIKTVKNSYEKNFTGSVRKTSRIANKSGGDSIATYLRTPLKMM